MQMRYLDLKGRASERRVRPLGCFYWSEVWTLAAWCEARADFRNCPGKQEDCVRVRGGDTVRFEACRAGRAVLDSVRADAALAAYRDTLVPAATAGSTSLSSSASSRGDASARAVNAVASLARSEGLGAEDAVDTVSVRG